MMTSSLDVHGQFVGGTVSEDNRSPIRNEARGIHRKGANCRKRFMDSSPRMYDNNGVPAGRFQEFVSGEKHNDQS